MATFIKWSLGNSSSLRIVHKRIDQKNVLLWQQLNYILSSMVCKIYFYSKFPDLQEKFQRGKETNSKAIIKVHNKRTSLKLTSHGMLHYLWSADHRKTFLIRLWQSLSFLDIREYILPGRKVPIILLIS